MARGNLGLFSNEGQYIPWRLSKKWVAIAAAAGGLIVLSTITLAIIRSSEKHEQVGTGKASSMGALTDGKIC